MAAVHKSLLQHLNTVEQIALTDHAVYSHPGSAILLALALEVHNFDLGVDSFTLTLFLVQLEMSVLPCENCLKSLLKGIIF